jgi:alginate O-acetyltransferase complex protein AlgJ
MAPAERVGGLAACSALTLLARCHPAADAPFPGGGGPVAAEHEQVRTLNDGYARTRSHVLVRQVDVPTRAALDYAAYHADFMIADPAPEALPPSDHWAVMLEL